MVSFTSQLLYPQGVFSTHSVQQAAAWGLGPVQTQQQTEALLCYQDENQCHPTSSLATILTELLLLAIVNLKLHV
jgi:hypothetical protein